jgi:hypothetical protein
MDRLDIFLSKRAVDNPFNTVQQTLDPSAAKPAAKPLPMPTGPIKNPAPIPLQPEETAFDRFLKRMAPKSPYSYPKYHYLNPSSKYFLGPNQ